MKGPRDRKGTLVCDGCVCLRTAQAGLATNYTCRHEAVTKPNSDGSVQAKPKVIGQHPTTPDWCPELAAKPAERRPAKATDGGGFKDADTMERIQQRAMMANRPPNTAPPEGATPGGEKAEGANDAPSEQVETDEAKDKARPEAALAEAIDEVYGDDEPDPIDETRPNPSDGGIEGLKAHLAENDVPHATGEKDVQPPT